MATLVRVAVGFTGATYASLAFSSDVGRANRKEPFRLMQVTAITEDMGVLLATFITAPG